MDIRSALKKGQSILIDNNIISAKLDSEILMSQAIRKNKKFIILNLLKYSFFIFSLGFNITNFLSLLIAHAINISESK